MAAGLPRDVRRIAVVVVIGAIMSILDKGGVSGATLSDSARARVADPLAEAFAHTYWFALALTALALIPALLLVREEAKARRAEGTRAARDRDPAAIAPA